MNIDADLLLTLNFNDLIDVFAKEKCRRKNLLLV